MKVEQASLYVPFRDLGCGDTFRVTHTNGNLYMKIALNNGDESMVNVENGCQCEIDDLDDYNVIPVAAKVIVK